MNIIKYIFYLFVVYGTSILFIVGLFYININDNIKMVLLIIPLAWWGYLGIGGGTNKIEHWLNGIFG